MSQLVAFNPRAGIPAYLQNVSVAGYTPPETRSGVPYGQLRIKKNPETKTASFVAIAPNGGDERVCGEDIAVCIVSHPRVGRSHFNQPYSEAAEAGSVFVDCWSPDGDKPDAMVAQPHAVTCASCPFAVSKVPNSCGYIMPLVLFFLADPTRTLYRFDAKAMSLFNKSATALRMDNQGNVGFMPFLGSKAEPGLVRTLGEGTHVGHYVTQMMVNVLDPISASFRVVDWLPQEHVDFLATIKEEDYALMSKVNPMPSQKATGSAPERPATPPPAAAATPGNGFGRPVAPTAPTGTAPASSKALGKPTGTPNFLSNTTSPAAVNSKVSTTEASEDDFNFGGK